MRPEELEAVCQEAARDLLAREGRPLPAAVVLPLPQSTKVTVLPDLPGDDLARAAYLARLAEDLMRPVNAPCYGFLAEADTAEGDVVLVVFGARGHAPRITAAPLSSGDDDGPSLGAWVPAEDLDAAALPFVRPLQQAAEAADPSQPSGGAPLPGWPRP